MSEINPEQLNNLLKSFIPESVEDMKEESIRNGIQQMRGALGSAEAVSFTNDTNKMFKEKGLTDEDGNPIEVENPSTALDNLVKDGKDYTCELTDEQDRWFRANKLYGNDIVGKLGFKNR